MGAIASMMYLDGKEVSDKEYAAEMDLKTMIEAEKIKNDPKRLKACMARKKKLAKALESLMDSHKGNTHKRKPAGSSHAY